MKKDSIIYYVILIALIDSMYLVGLFVVNKELSLYTIMNYSRELFRLVYVTNIIMVSTIIAKLINIKKDIISIRPIKIENNMVLFSTQTKKNMEMFTDLQKYYIYESNSKRFVIDRFYQIDRNKYGELKKNKKKGFPEAYDLHKYKLKDFR